MKRLICASAALLAVCQAAPSSARESSGDEAGGSPEQQVLYEVKTEHDIFKFDYGAPTSPAMTLLGLTPDKTPPSTSLTEFVVSLPTLYGEEAGQSIAVDVPAARVFQAFQPRSAATFDVYVNGSTAYRIGYRTRLGMAALNGNDGGGDPAKAIASRLSLGFSTSLLDSADPLMVGDRQLKRCLQALSPLSQPIINGETVSAEELALGVQMAVIDDLAGGPSFDRQRALTILGVAPGPGADALTEAVLRERLRKLRDSLDIRRAAVIAEGSGALDKKLAAAGVTKKVARCTESANRMARFATDLDIGAGVLAQGEPGRLEDLEWRGSVLWVAFKHPLGTPVFADDETEEDLSPLPESGWLVVVSGRLSWDERLQTGDTLTPEFRADTADAWVGLERLTPRYRFTAQYGWLETSAREVAGKPFEKSGERYLLSGQFRLGGKESSMWIGVSYGNGYGTTGDLDAETALVTLSYSPTPVDITGGR